LHVDLAPLGGIRTDPNILVALGNPEGSTAAEDGRLSGEFALQPVRMIFRKSVRRLVCVCRNALCARNVNESVVVRLMGLFGDRTDSSKFFGGIEKTLVATGNVVVDFNTEDSARSGVGDDLGRALAVESVGADADVVRPVLVGGNGL